VGIFLLCVLVACVSFAAGGYLGLVKAVKTLEKPEVATTHPTYIYSAPLGETDGSRRVIGTIMQGENRKSADPEEIPDSLLNALVAKEDERFREHGGVDVWGIMRALYVDFRAGETVEGASTITQQYVKNAYLTQDQTWKRKIKEALISIELERSVYSDERLGKDQILVDYLNTVYFGANAYGAEAAAETYFNKSVEDLTTAESATLVGLLWSPSTLSNDREAAVEQRNLVIEKMFDAGYITEQDQDVALEEPLPDEWPAAPITETGLVGPQLTRNFAEMVQDELVAKYGANNVLEGGMSVYTTLDLEMQVEAQNIIYDESTGYLPLPDDPDAALVSLEPETGYVRAMVGNRDQGSHFNLVTQGQRQPGSSFKPFALIAALEQGIDPDTEFVSEEKEYMVEIEGGTQEKWKVENYEKAERGSISLKQGLWQSDNTVFTDLVMNVDGQGLTNGPEQIVDVAKRLGIGSDFADPPHPSVVLGTQETSPMDMAVAYATIANGGEKVEPRSITKVIRHEGEEDEKVLFTAEDEVHGEQVLDPDIAAQTTEIMMGDIINGIAGEAALDNRQVAGKTGTSERFFDAWFVGSTPQLTTGVWMGYAEGGQTLQARLGPQAQEAGLEYPSPTDIFHAYMTEAMEGLPVEEFENVDPPKPVPPPPLHAGAATTVTGTPAATTTPQTPYTVQ
jgi:membrane peptidoglycan carboxypeptidase